MEAKKSKVKGEASVHSLPISLTRERKTLEVDIRICFVT